MTVKELIAKEGSNSDFISKIQTIKTPEVAYAIAQEFGFTESYEVFIEEMKAFRETYGELSEADLAMVAGGKSGEEKAELGLTIVEGILMLASF